jgi:hypothetical protein
MVIDGNLAGHGPRLLPKDQILPRTGQISRFLSHRQALSSLSILDM